MSRRVAAVAVCLVLAAPAGAQTPPPDPRDAARAFADAALRFQGSLAPLEPRYREIGEAALPPCVLRTMRGMPERRVLRVSRLAFTNYWGELGRLFDPPLTEFSSDLHGVQTADPALRAGRTAWRRMRRVVAELAEIPRLDVCAEVRRYVDGGFEPTPAFTHVRRLRALMERDPLDDFDRRVERAKRRLIELGIPREQARLFERDIDDAFESPR